MSKFFKITASIFITTFIGCSSPPSTIYQEEKPAIKETSKAYHYLKQLVSPSEGIGAREAGSAKEKETARFIARKFSEFGYNITIDDFSFEEKGEVLHSKNIIANLGDQNRPTIIIAAHYDSTAAASGSMGATDNGAGVAAMLAIAQAITHQASGKYNIRFIAFGAEEVGLKGSNHYVRSLIKQEKIANIVAMVNFDTIAGGDKVYVHSAHSTPYEGCNTSNYNSDTTVREALLKASAKTLGEQNKYIIHPDYNEYPEGETGSWSDHASFSCAGIPIAYVESTNFSLDGKNGRDGYSQTSTESLWTCYDKENKASCDRKIEKKWGEIWHTKYDSLAALDAFFPGRVEKQIEDNVKVLIELLTHLEMYFPKK